MTISTTYAGPTLTLPSQAEAIQQLSPDALFSGINPYVASSLPIYAFAASSNNVGLYEVDCHGTLVSLDYNFVFGTEPVVISPETLTQPYQDIALQHFLFRFSASFYNNPNAKLFSEALLCNEESTLKLDYIGLRIPQGTLQYDHQHQRILLDYQKLDWSAYAPELILLKQWMETDPRLSAAREKRDACLSAGGTEEEFYDAVFNNKLDTYLETLQHMSISDLHTDAGCAAL